MSPTAAEAPLFLALAVVVVAGAAGWAAFLLVDVIRERLHDRWLDRVCSLLDGELEADEAAVVRDHLAECVRCRRFLGDVAHLDAMVDRRTH